MNDAILRSYLLVAVRNLARNPLYSGINIIGLALGIACCLLILLFVRDELSYDRWIPDAERIYRLESTFILPGREPMDAAQSPGPARAAVLKDFAGQIENAVRLFERKPTVSVGSRQFNDKLLEVDAEFFSVFALDFIAGSAAQALADTSSVVLTESMARKYFGATPAVGKTLTVTREKPETFKVSAVIRDLPRSSHLDVNLIALFDPARYAERPWVTDSWTSVNTYIYLKLRTATGAQEVSRQLQEFTTRNAVFDIPDGERIKPGDVLRFNLQPLTSIHLHTANRVGFKPGGDITTVYTFSAVALLILFIACVNFMNLSTARSQQRAREVSLRKVHGASRTQLIVQFLGESVLMTLIALMLALLATTLTLPWFNAYVDKQLQLDLLGEPALFALLPILTVVVGVVGGLYPAFFLSRFQPAVVLKAGRATSGSGSGRLRAALVLLQFTISIGLIVATLVVYAQWRFARDIDLGYDARHLLSISPAGGAKLESRQDALRQELMKLPGVRAVGRASDAPPMQDNNNTLVTLPGVQSDDLLVLETVSVDFQFFATLGVQPLAGRVFSAAHAADVMPHDADQQETPIHAGVVVNELALKRLGFSDPAGSVGQSFRVGVGPGDKMADVTVVGVIPDLHLRSVHDAMTPTLYFVADHAGDFYSLVLSLESTDLAATLAAIDRTWAELIPEVPIQRGFVDDNFAALYAAEMERMKMFGGFSALAVLVACLGLFGLASFSADRRTREIGIRKVLGASSTDLLRLLLWQFSIPVLIANLLAWPIAWYFLQVWLNNFPYRIELSLLPFATAGVMALLIAWGTVLHHARRVAGSAAVVALRYE